MPVPLRHRFLTGGLLVEEYLLLEYRAARAHHYNRDQPGDGLLVWHIRSSFENNLLEVLEKSPEGLPPETIRLIIYQILKGLAYLHS